MLICSLMLLKSRAALVRDTYREYMDSTRENSKITEQRALAVSPDHKTALLNCFRLQDLLRERATLRFEFLIKTQSFNCAPYKSLDAISERLDTGWTEAEEGAIKESNAHYKDVSREIADIRSKWDPDSLTAPLRALTQDSQYKAASRHCSWSTAASPSRSLWPPPTSMSMPAWALFSAKKNPTPSAPTPAPSSSSLNPTNSTPTPAASPPPGALPDKRGEAPPD